MAAGDEPGVQEHLACHWHIGLLSLGQPPDHEQRAQVVESGSVIGWVGANGLGQLVDGIVSVALGQHGLGGLHIFFGCKLFCGGHVLVEELADFGLGLGADETIDRLATLEHDAKRDAAHAEHLRELPGDVGLGVRVQLGELEPTGIGDLELLEHRPERLARPAPWRPDVEQHRLLGRRLDEFDFEVLKRDVDHVVGSVDVGWTFPHLS